MPDIYELEDASPAPADSSVYELEDAPAAATTEARVGEDVPDKLANLKRNASLITRAVGTGIAGLADAGLRAGPASPFSPATYRGPTLRSSIDALAAKLGVTPETNNEKLASAAIEGAAGSAIPGGGTAATLANILGGATGGGASEAVRQAGGSPTAQAAAGVIAGMSPSSLSKLMQASVRGAIRGGREGLQHLRETYDKYVSAGVIPSALMAADNRRSNWLDSVFSYMLGSGGVMTKDKKRVLDEMRARLERNIADFSQTGSPEEVGRDVVRGVQGDDGFREIFKGRTRELNDKLDTTLGENFRVGLDDVSRTLANMNAEMPGAPAISQLWKNSELVRIEEAIRSDLTSAEAQLSRPDISEATKAILREGIDVRNGVGQVDRLGESQAALEKQLAAMDAENQKAGLFDMQRRRALTEESGMAGSSAGAKLADLDRAEAAAREARAPILRQLEEVRTMRASKMNAEEFEALLKQMQDGKVPIKAVQRLRTLVGENLENQIFMSTVPRSRWKSVYAALSNDLETAIRDSGDEKAMREFVHAQTYYRNGMRHLERIAPVIDRFTNGGGAEGVYTAAVSGLKDGATTLRAVLSALPKDSQKFLVASFVRRMGTAAANDQNTVSSVFSPERYLTAYANLAPEAKRALFERFGQKWQQDMDKISWVAGKLRERGQEFHTPEAVVQQSLGAGKLNQIIISALTFAPKAFMTTLGGIVAPYGMARWMTNPKFVEFLARSTELPTSGIPGSLAALNKVAEQDHDQDLKDAAAYLRVQLGLAGSKGPKTRRRSSIPELSALQSSVGTE